MYGPSADVYSLGITFWDLLHPNEEKYPDTHGHHLKVYEAVLSGMGVAMTHCEFVLNCHRFHRYTPQHQLNATNRAPGFDSVDVVPGPNYKTWNERRCRFSRGNARDHHDSSCKNGTIIFYFDGDVSGYNALCSSAFNVFRSGNMDQYLIVSGRERLTNNVLSARNLRA